jgi:hypothetical protein
MFTALDDFDVPCFNPVDKPVFLIYPAAPPSGQIVFERLWFPYSFVVVKDNLPSFALSRVCALLSQPL